MLEKFYICSRCGKTWMSLPDFLEDAELLAVGYQAHFEHLEEGLIFFNHTCGTTLSLPAVAFRSLQDGPVIQRPTRAQPESPGHCLRKDDLKGCPDECECTYVRDILTRIRAWPKRR